MIVLLVNVSFMKLRKRALMANSAIIVSGVEIRDTRASSIWLDNRDR
ncbi:MAG: hypothetical protein N3F04_02570 [Candidatus Nezhaarchaeota archaeon]|nr:hypothetical protein [Candidatus Nezhaarchaeota archaeon]MCX8141655.1 hypothetical protein [Candidatus Nezhaarchaeota archaeon]MDW8049922.1 hypothetical protein [Nitrososphaerota archaeon]